LRTLKCPSWKFRQPEGWELIDALIIDGVSIEDCIIQIGEMDYGFGINGIIGGDLLMRTKMLIDYEKCAILLN